MEIFYNLNTVMVSSFLKTFESWAPWIAFLLFAVQSALPVFPYIILAAAAGMIFGFKLGFILAWTGALAGACVAYGLFRWLGRGKVKNLLKKYWSYDVEKINGETAFWSILLARIIPVIPTPLINIAAAWSEVPFWNFFFSSAFGKLPTAIVYTGLGVCLFNVRDGKLILLIVIGFVALVVGLRVGGKKMLSQHYKHPSVKFRRVRHGTLRQ
jgi:uncharacterized membrane protein YdjX (TVP38/TMEM64 family)